MVDFANKLDDLRWRKSLPKFWSDAFDTDLLRVFPNIRDLLGSPADVPIWTLSRETYGRLNCPCAWNTYSGLCSFLWLQKPNLPRDKNGWVNINGCVTTDPEIEGTWLEWLRDQWVHGHDWSLQPNGTRFVGIDYNRCFYPIMANIRGWEGYQDVTAAKRSALLWLTKANRRFARCVEAFSIGRNDYPYFPKASLPGVAKQH